MSQSSSKNIKAKLAATNIKDSVNIQTASLSSIQTANLNKVSTSVNTNRSDGNLASTSMDSSSLANWSQLPPLESNPEGNINVDIKPTLPPPVFIKGVISFPALCSELIEQIGVDNFSCKSSTDRLKIMTTNPTSYRTLIHFLKNQKAEYHTYQLKEDKPT
ncbi:Hypothetical protein CINCED_3A019214 [Cinara cedri]|uniref:Pre-C2HC domain-containing protein n=1 Tax=Cinara cedri TaxID=506608 RepID=A0A5E4N4I6_9HEMI|nr:Hypothetical protein CINCED_3A019214 [Cinara cedri]